MDRMHGFASWWFAVALLLMGSTSVAGSAGLAELEETTELEEVGRTAAGGRSVVEEAATDTPTLPSFTEVADAARDDRSTEVRELLRQGRDVNAAHGDGFTALHWAALSDDAELANMLLYAGAYKEARTRIGGHTPLLVAASSGSREVAEILVASGAEIDAETANGATALLLASGAGDVAVIDLLLEAGASPWSREKAFGQTALHFAAGAGRTEAVQRLVQAGAEHCATTKIYDAAAAEKVIRSKQRAKYMRGRKKPGSGEAGGPEAKGKKGKGTPNSNEKAGAENGKKASQGGKEAESGKHELTAADPERKRKGKNGRKGRWWRRSNKAKEVPPKPLSFGQLVGDAGGMTPLHYAVREGHAETARALLGLGADINHLTDGDRSTPLLVATLNGHFDLAMDLLEGGADPRLASAAGVTPLYVAINVFWAPHSFYPQPTKQYQQKATLYQVLQAFLDHGADVNARLTKKVWYTGYNFDQSGVDETGATAFWRAAQAADVEAMKLLVAGGANWRIPTLVVPERRSPNGRNADQDLNKNAPKIGDDAVSPFLVASGAGYVGNFHRVAPGGFLRAARYFIEELGANVNSVDAKGRTALHNAAMRGDNQMLYYFILRGADVEAVTRSGDNAADMANGPVQRIQPFPETLALLEILGVRHNDRCVSC